MTMMTTRPYQRYFRHSRLHRSAHSLNNGGVPISHSTRRAAVAVLLTTTTVVAGWLAPPFANHGHERRQINMKKNDDLSPLAGQSVGGSPWSPAFSLSSSYAAGGRSFLSASRTSRLDAAPESDDWKVSNDYHQRTYQTWVDQYYQQHESLPPPAVKHVELTLSDNPNNHDNDDDNNNPCQNILIIGDVHGCCQELLDLERQAQWDHNGGRPFALIVLVGDLVNKGPASLAVIRHVRQRQYGQEDQEHQNNNNNNNNRIPLTPSPSSTQWLAVRGNHDDAALLAALGDPRRRAKPTYQWVFGKPLEQEQPLELQQEEAQQQQLDKNNPPFLTDEDVEWLANLPYTIRIPRKVVTALSSSSSSSANTDTNNNKQPLPQADKDYLIVHAGLVPNLDLDEQKSQDMTTMRTIVQVRDSKDGDRPHWSVPPPASAGQQPEYPWATIWKGPEHVVFGHDARRGLQLCPRATGLDTGAVYGKKLTGLILPSLQLVQVPAVAEHASIPFPNKTKAPE